MIVIDTHTGGEPTRTIVEGGPNLGQGPLSDRLALFAEKFDEYRQMAVLEPRGSEAMVGALLCEPSDPSHSAAVIFFNAAGYLGMCGHGTIGLAATLFYMGRIGVGKHCFETPVGSVDVDVIGPNTVKVDNVPSYRYKQAVTLDVPNMGLLTGDVAWGGNWFFLAGGRPPKPLVPENIADLTGCATAIVNALANQGVTGKNGAVIDHVEFFDTTPTKADSRNFVLCPDGSYDRSPCGTGTSAKLACLAADGKLQPGQQWIQESIIGSRFHASYSLDDEGNIVPSIKGEAFVCGETHLIFDENDPFRSGIDFGASRR